MSLFSYIKQIGLPISFLLFIFLLNLNELLTIQIGYLMVAAVIILKGNTLVHNIDRDFLAILAFSFTFSLFAYFGENRGLQYLIIQATLPVIFYSLGKLMIPSKVTNKGIIYLLVTIGFVYSFTALLSIISNIVAGGFVQVERFLPSYWTGLNIKSTTWASYLIYNTILPAIVVASRKRLGIFEKIFMLAIFAVSLIASFRLGSRTLIVISILSMMLAFGYVVSKQTLLENLKFLAVSALLVLLVYFFVPFDLNSPIFSTLGQRLVNQGAVESTATAGNRTFLWAVGVEKLVENPLGWTYHQHHHNLWLDIAKIAGFIPLLFFLLSNIFCYKSIRKIFKDLKVELGVKVTFFLFFLSTLLLFFTEPVIEGNFFSIVVYCLLLGIMNGFIKEKINIGNIDISPPKSTGK